MSPKTLSPSLERSLRAGVYSLGTAFLLQTAYKRFNFNPPKALFWFATGLVANQFLEWRHEMQGTMIQGGLADKAGKRPGDFDPVALDMGIRFEMEHTDDPRIAREIAMDHLTEHPTYYDALCEMERRLKSMCTERHHYN